MYSYYCQNIPQSEELRRQVGENNPFLRQCQTSLGHKLPLSAYLLKPVQRITKYQLLLRDLMKYSQSPLDSSDDVQHEDNDLQSALDAMLAVVRCVNDSMHQVAITGYQVKSFYFILLNYYHFQTGWKDESFLSCLHVLE